MASKRRRIYNTIIVGCADQSTSWLLRCFLEPSEGMRRLPVVMLALRTILRERFRSP